MEPNYEGTTSLENFNNSDDSEYYLLVSERCPASRRLRDMLRDKGIESFINVVFFENNPDFVRDFRRQNIIIDRVPTMIIHKTMYDAHSKKDFSELIKKTDSDLFAFISNNDRNFFINNNNIFDYVNKASAKESKSNIEEDINREIMLRERPKK